MRPAYCLLLTLQGFPALVQGEDFLLPAGPFSRNCLPNAINASERQNITMAGESMPIGLLFKNSRAPKIPTFLFEILLQEVLGYNTSALRGTLDSGAWPYLAGCQDPELCGDANASFQVARSHFAVGEAHKAEKQDMQNDINFYHPRQAAELLGDTGYSYQEVVAVPKAVIRSARKLTGFDLSDFASYDTSVNDPSRFFLKITELPISILIPCDSPKQKPSSDMLSSKMMEDYHTHFGSIDPDGVIQYVNADGNIAFKLNCHVNNTWWISPACRNNTDKCVPFVTHDGGLGPAMMQRATAYSMPIAIATVNIRKIDKDIAKTQGCLFFSKSPDIFGFTHAEDNDILRFKAYNRDEHNIGLYTSSLPPFPYINAANRNMSLIAPRVYKLAQRMTISETRLTKAIRKALDVYTNEGIDGQRFWFAACDLLKDPVFEESWRSWIAAPWECDVQWGLHSETSGEPVLEVSDDASCQRCPPGRYSSPVNSTHVCKTCPAGEAVNFFGATMCTTCSMGRFSGNSGASACTLCPLGSYANTMGTTACDFCREGESTFVEKRDAQGVSQWASLEGAASSASCGCKIGTQWDGTRCTSCGIGLDCSAGMGKVIIKSGYAWDGHLGVYDCHIDPRRCPGGVPGANCAEGRVEDSIGCSTCLDQHTEAEDGKCRPCGRSDMTPFIVLVTFLSLGLIAAYVMVERKRPGIHSEPVVIMIMFGQMITLFQQLGVLGSIAIEWTSPIRDVLKFLALFAFDFNLIRQDCVMTLGPAGKYTTRVVVVAFCFVVICFTHLCIVAVKYKNQWRRSMASLINSLGGILMVFFVSIVCTIFQPMQCHTHPNGIKTLMGYPTVRCWTDREHEAMLIVGCVSLILPISFMAVCIRAVLRFRVNMNKRNLTFLAAYQFLFARFSPQAYWFAPILLARNALVAATVALSDSVAQIMTVFIVMLISIVMTVYFRPWRVRFANWLDLAGQITVLLVSAMAAFYVDTEDLSSVSYLCAIVVVSVVLAIPCAILNFIFMAYVMKRRKTFKFFLCHHKAGAGCFARLLMMKLSKNGGDKVFIDSDDLQNLDKLFDYAGFESETIVLLASRDVLRRPWCMGELVTAKINKVNVVPIVFPDFQMPSDGFIQAYTDEVDIRCLSEYGIDEGLVKPTLEWIRGLPSVEWTGELSTSILESVCKNITQRNYSKIEHSTNMSTQSTRKMIDDKRVAIIADKSNYEAMACAMILHDLLLPLTIHAPEHAPYVHESDACLSDNVTKLIVICTHGVFEQGYVLRALHSAYENNASLIPVLADEAFRFPTPAFLKAQQPSIEAKGLDVEMTTALISAVFKEIAVVFQPQQYSSTASVLSLRAEEVAKRIAASGNSVRSRISKISTPSEESDTQHLKL